MNNLVVCLYIFFIFESILIQTYNLEQADIPYTKISAALNNKNAIHFIRCGTADSILIESNGQYGLIDSSNPYKNIENEVEPAQIDESKGEVNQWMLNPDDSVQAVIDYLDYLEVKKLDFILGTHAHSDHIGGIPAIAYKFVDSNTKYFYRKYRKTQEDTTHIDWANYKYYLAAVHSMEKKGANLIEITNKKIRFNFGDFSLELLNTDIDPDELNEGENQNSIVTLLKYKDIKVFLASDMITKDDRKIKDDIGKIDILKLSHHGITESSYDFLSTTRPDYAIISNTNVPGYSNQLINYMQDILKSKIYLTGNVPGASENVNNSAIILNFEENSFSFTNTGKEVTPDGNANGWSSWDDKWTYLEKGKTVKGWKKLSWSEGKDTFYFTNEGIMVTGWQELSWSGGINWFYFKIPSGNMLTRWQYLEGRDGEKNWFYFDESNGNMLTGWQYLEWSGGKNWFYFKIPSGNMITGWQYLEWSGGKNWFYFLPENGAMVQNTCMDIDGKQYCFDENGCLI